MFLASLEFVEYVAPPVVGVAYLLFLLVTRQQLVRSSLDALGAWRVARTVELDYVHTFSPEDAHMRLVSLAATLGDDDPLGRRDLAARIRKLIDPPQGIPPPTPAELHAMLPEAMRQEFDARDTL